MIERIAALIHLAPERPAGSPGERLVQEQLAAELQAAGLAPTWQEFSFRGSLYAYMAVEFGLATGALALWWVSPWLAAALHLWTLVSWLGHATRRWPAPTRWLLPRHTSANLISTRPATAPLRRRVVLMGHADAAWTGWLFRPEVARLGARGQPMLTLTLAMLALLTLDVGVAVLGGGWAAWGVGGLLSLPLAVATLTNGQVALRREVVPGALDNLTGCVGAVHIAERLSPDLPDDIELIVVITGSEEAGTLGAEALARHVSWERDRTLVLNMDGLTNGLPYLIHEGEVLPLAWDERLEARALALAHALDLPLTTRRIPAGGTDALPLRLAGYATLSLVCIDPAQGTPLHYHHPSDTAENLDPVQLERSVHFFETLAREATVQSEGAPDGGEGLDEEGGREDRGTGALDRRSTRSRSEARSSHKPSPTSPTGAASAEGDAPLRAPGPRGIG